MQCDIYLLIHLRLLNIYIPGIVVALGKGWEIYKPCLFGGGASSFFPTGMSQCGQPQGFFFHEKHAVTVIARRSRAEM